MNKKILLFLLMTVFLFAMKEARSSIYLTGQNSISGEKETAEETAANSGFDFSAMDKIWGIISILERDEEPPEQVWADLVRTPGYSVLIFHERRYGLDFLKRNLRLVFKPSREAELKAALSKDASYMLNSFISHKNEMSCVMRAVEQLRDGQVFKKQMDRVSALLPRKCEEDFFSPSLSFIYFNGDVRYGYPVMVADPMWLIETESFPYYLKAYLIAVFADRIRPFNEADLTQRQYAYVDGLERIQRHGFCDLLAADDGTLEKMDMYARYQSALPEFPQRIEELDAVLARAESDPHAWKEFAVAVVGCSVRPGYPVGYRMARIIQDILGREALAQSLGNPFAFVRLYQEAALKKGGLPIFSDSAMRTISSIEKEIVGKESHMKKNIFRSLKQKYAALSRFI